MATITVDEEKLKDLLQSALIEVLEKHRNLMQNIVEEALVDIALSHAIEEGLRSESVPQDEVLAIIENK